MKIRIADDVVYRDLAGEAVILDLATGTYFGLDPVGTRVWQLLAEHGVAEDVVRALLPEYDVDEEQLRGDIDGLIRQLVDAGLVGVDDANAPAVG